MEFFAADEETMERGKCSHREEAVPAAACCSLGEEVRAELLLVVN